MGLMGTSSARRRSLQPAPAASPAPSFSIGPTGQMQQHPQAPAPVPQVSAGKWQPGVQSGGQSEPSSMWDNVGQGSGPGRGMFQTKQNINANPHMLNNLPDAGGVVSGAPAGNAVTAAGGQQAPAFDPNDPNNAALSGYMNAR